MTFIGKIHHRPISGSVPKRNEFIKLLARYRYLDPMYFLLTIAIFSNKITCENIVDKFCLR